MTTPPGPRALLLLLVLIGGAALLLPQKGCSLLLGFVGGPTLRDVRIDRIEVLREQPEAAGIFGAGAEMPWLGVHITVERDLSLYGRWYQSSVNLDAALCEGPSPSWQRRLASSGPWTEEGGAIGYGMMDQPETPHRPDAVGRFLYVLYLHVRTRGTVERAGQPARDARWAEHDFRRDAGDVCFEISGGAPWGGSHRSGPFVIPYALIAGALARAGMPHAAAP